MQSLQDEQTQCKDNVENLAKKVGEFNVEMAKCTSLIEALQNENDDTLIKTNEKIEKLARAGVGDQRIAKRP